MRSLEQSIRKNAIISGLMLGIYFLALTIFIFYFTTSLVTSIPVVVYGPMILGSVISLTLVIFFCLRLRKKIGGLWNFRQASTGIFIMFFFAALVIFVGRNLIFNGLIEPNARQKTEAVILRTGIDQLKESGASQARITAKIAEIKSQFYPKNGIPPAQIIIGQALNIVWLAVLALVAAAIFKKNPASSVVK